MIIYKYGFCSPWCKGSIVPNAMLIALPSAILGVVIHDLQAAAEREAWDFDWGHEAFNISPAAYGGFLSVLGFLVIYRTSGAHARFVTGSHAVSEMVAAYFDSASTLIAFMKGTKKDPKVVKEFQFTIIRLYSLLNALCYVKMEGDEISDSRLRSLEVIDMEGLDKGTIKALDDDHTHMVEHVYCWILAMVSDAVSTNLIVAPPPMSNRILAKLSEGLAKMETCRKIALVPFPFPYAQATLWLLMVHYIVAPLVMCRLAPTSFTVFVFTFFQVFMMWSLILISWQLENPFGEDANDLPTAKNQQAFNERLRILVKPSAFVHTPYFTKGLHKHDSHKMNSLYEFFGAVDEELLPGASEDGSSCRDLESGETESFLTPRGRTEWS